MTPAHDRAQPLETRHVFLDTQVYHKLRHNTDNPAFRALANHVQLHKVVLHITDITMFEVERQIREAVLARQRELGGIERDLARWRPRAPDSTPAEPLGIDANTIAKDLYRRFLADVLVGCEAIQHRSLSLPAEVVFKTYFRRAPPFDFKGSKEFPDAFVLASLEQWCVEKDTRLYVVSEDGAMRRAAAASERLIAVKTIDEILKAAAAELGGHAEHIADAILGEPGFDFQLQGVIEDGISNVTFIYAGDLPDGEAYEGRLVEIISVDDWSVVGLGGDRISLILNVNAKVGVDVQYEDRSESAFNWEGERWLGGGTTTTYIEANVSIKTFLEVNTKTGSFIDGQVLDTDIVVYER